MRHVAIALAVGLSGLPALAAGDLQELRENLVRLSISENALAGQTISVFCLIEVDGVWCLVLNATGASVGRQCINVEPKDPSTYNEVLNNCPGPMGRNVADRRAFEVDVFVDDAYGLILPKAVSFKPISDSKWRQK